MLRESTFDKFNLNALAKCYYGFTIMTQEIIRELTDSLLDAKQLSLYAKQKLQPIHFFTTRRHRNLARLENYIGDENCRQQSSGGTMG